MDLDTAASFSDNAAGYSFPRSLYSFRTRDTYNLCRGLAMPLIARLRESNVSPWSSSWSANYLSAIFGGWHASG